MVPATGKASLRRPTSPRSRAVTADETLLQRNSGACPADEEMANAAFHGIGLVLGLIGTVIIGWLSRSDDLLVAAVCLLYAATLVATYAVSTLSHAVQQPLRKYRLRTWDQGVIYFLIVGTYTPLLWKFAPAHLVLPVLAGLWLAALAGFISKVAFEHRVDGTFSAVSYIALGWLPAMALLQFVPAECMNWLALGGAFYTVGVIFLKFDRHVRYFHVVWHVFVILGSAAHYYAIIQFVVLPSQAIA